MKIFFPATLFALLSIQAYSQDGKPTPIRVTEGPMLGRPETHSMTIWVRTDRQGKVKVFYGKNADHLDQAVSSKPAEPNTTTRARSPSRPLSQTHVTITGSRIIS